MDIRGILDSPSVYAAWQSPFVSQKIAPLLLRNDIAQIGRVLEIGCGPGTNAAYFQNADYVGIDLNSQYIESARKKYSGEFLCGDAASFQLESDEPFDAVFMNSLLHHLDDQQVAATMEQAASRLIPGGQLHVLDLILPDQRSISRFLARADRGHHPRSRPQWEALLGEKFDPNHIEPYPVRFCGVTCWQMLYFRGTRRD